MAQLLNHPLMENNITAEDRKVLIQFLEGDPILTNGPQVLEFEKKWSEWLGCRYSVFVNSGASANLLTIATLKILKGQGEVIVPTLTWVSDIASVLQNGMTPVFVDINPKNLCMDVEEILKKITPQTKAVFFTHVLGFNGLSEKLIKTLQEKNIPLIEDVCESHGATFKGRRLGSYGWVSNFSFYYAHHMSTIEGGMLCTNDEETYQIMRMLRSHGMVREAKSDTVKNQYKADYPDLNPDFIFAHPAYNVRSTEINAVLGLHQLQRLDENNRKRVDNFKTFLTTLDAQYFVTDFDIEGAVNYGFVVLLKKADEKLRDRLEAGMRESKIEFRRGTAGGGNQLRQPYLRNIVAKNSWNEFKHVEHVHFYGYYIGNYPNLEKAKIIQIAQRLNEIVKGH